MEYFQYRAPLPFDPSNGSDSNIVSCTPQASSTSGQSPFDFDTMPVIDNNDYVPFPEQQVSLLQQHHLHNNYVPQTLYQHNHRNHHQHQPQSTAIVSEFDDDLSSNTQVVLHNHGRLSSRSSSFSSSLSSSPSSTASTSPPHVSSPLTSSSSSSSLSIDNNAYIPDNDHDLEPSTELEPSSSSSSAQPRRRGRKALPLNSEPYTKKKGSATSSARNSTQIVNDRIRRCKFSQSIRELRALLHVSDGNVTTVVQASLEKLRDYMANDTNLAKPKTLSIPSSSSSSSPSSSSSSSSSIPIPSSSSSSSSSCSSPSSSCTCARTRLTLNPLSCYMNDVLIDDMLLMHIDCDGFVAGVNDVFERVTGFHRSLVLGRRNHDAPLHAAKAVVPSIEYIQRIATQLNYPKVGDLSSKNNKNDEDEKDFNHVVGRDELLHIDPASPTLISLNESFYSDHNHAGLNPPSSSSSSSSSSSPSNCGATHHTLTYQYPVPFSSSYPLPQNKLIMVSPRICSKFQSTADMMKWQQARTHFFRSAKTSFKAMNMSIPIIFICHSAFGMDCEWLMNVKPLDGGGFILYSASEHRRFSHGSSSCKGVDKQNYILLQNYSRQKPKESCTD